MVLQAQAARRWLSGVSSRGGSSGPIRAQHRDRRRIAVQVNVLIPANRPGLLRAHASHQAHND